jgi:hypothetical protein
LRGARSEARRGGRLAPDAQLRERVFPRRPPERAARGRRASGATARAVPRDAEARHVWGGRLRTHGAPVVSSDHSQRPSIAERERAAWHTNARITAAGRTNVPCSTRKPRELCVRIKVKL